jgi:hypothetical protein
MICAAGNYSRSFRIEGFASGAIAAGTCPALMRERWSKKNTSF